MVALLPANTVPLQIVSMCRQRLLYGDRDIAIGVMPPAIVSLVVEGIVVSRGLLPASPFLLC